ncbi:MAG: hypothetical protein NZ521_09975, partial [Flammeovirgaceae bacterium]|nr:hypothetical protein [Flammeovirgaceae bacterium]MDW8288565.1 hypothetical protein [Flammeovirgaceae bacterium]
KSPQYWLKRSSGVLWLVIMLFSFVRETSDTDYQFIQRAFYAINTKTVHWWNHLKEKGQELEQMQQIMVADNVCESLPEATKCMVSSNIPTEKLPLKTIPLKEIALLKSHTIEEIIPHQLSMDDHAEPSVNEPSKPREEEKIPTPSYKQGILNNIFSIDSLFKSLHLYSHSPHWKPTWRLSIVSKHIRNYQRELTHAQHTYGFGTLFGRYLANQRLLLQTGAIYGKYVRSQINTELRKEDKKIKVDYLSLRGDFHLIDIPLTLQYNFKSVHPEYQFFVSSSLSNYLFVQEDVRKASLPSDIRNAGNEVVYPTKGLKFGERMDWASSITLSVGLEKRLSKYTSVSAEPYVLIPLKGVGSESMKLHATGLMLKLNFQGSQYKSH